jgi:hypothetical protein
MDIRRLVGTLVFVATATAASMTMHAQAGSAPAVPVKATVDQLAWVSGAWTGMLGDRTIEQHWSTPLAGSIVAMYRSIQANKPTLYELLAMENSADTVVLRIKHFTPGPGLVGQEAKDQSVDQTLVKLEDRLAVFEGGTPDAPIRVTFRSPDAAMLNITVERQRNGAPVATEFNYHRISRP